MSPDAGPSPPLPSAPQDAASLPEGLRINEYQIERPLGGGGFGITYLARDCNLQLPVAIKEYFPSDLVTRTAELRVQVRGGENQENQQLFDWGLERFLEEARALATFRHPNIVRVLRYFRDNGTAYIVMEYESGLPLKRWVPQNAPLSRQSLLAILYPVLDGLEAVHQAGFLHRDVKPDNIYVRADDTPVLLDFGAARRVTGNRDLTNIVSPGFAPFEQYHSNGNQGPWTDICSLGAVMYWMTTGKKPIEAAARVKNDAMLPASSLAEVGVYGSALLNAIEWALQPEEGRRPQSIALFRTAILGSEKISIPGSPADGSDRPAVKAAGHYASVPLTPAPSGAGVAQRRTLLGTIMFLDLIGYSVRSGDDQVALKRLFNEVVGKALKGVPEDTRIVIDTGDGAAICFLGDPEEALNSGMLLRDLLGQRYGKLLSVRIGLHIGPIRVVSDINDRVNVIGDGINVAQRVMDFAQTNQLLVSRSYYDVISRITDDTAELFQFLGQHEDKHGRLHEIYSVSPVKRGTGNTQREGPSTGYSQTLPVKPMGVLDPDEVSQIEAELARHIGPLARILVRKAQPLARSTQALRDALAPSIQEPKAREAFVTASSSSHSRPTPSRPPGSGRSSSQFDALDSGSGSFPAARGAPLSQPLSHPISKPPGTSSGSAKGLEITAPELLLIEQALSRFIGPMARMLVRKEIGQHAHFKDFVAALAAHVDDPQRRPKFAQDLRQLLSKRSC